MSGGRGSLAGRSKARQPRWYGPGVFRLDRRGQSAAIGTILAILVLLTILTVITTRWVPPWVEGREADHASIVDSQFAEFKKTVDQQVLSGVPGVGVGNPITLGQTGVPIFAPGSFGTINLGSYGAGLFQNQLVFENDTGGFAQTAFGSIKYSTANTQYIQQSHLYEFGAVIVNQSDGQLMKSGPALAIDNRTGSTQLQLTMISLHGDGTTYSGDDTIGVRTQLEFAPIITQLNYTTPQTFWLNVTSESPDAWLAFLNKTISRSLQAGDYNITVDTASSTVSVQFTDVTRVWVSYNVLQATLDIA